MHAWFFKTKLTYYMRQKVKIRNFTNYMYASIVIMAFRMISVSDSVDSTHANVFHTLLYPTLSFPQEVMRTILKDPVIQQTRYPYLLIMAIRDAEI